MNFYFQPRLNTSIFVLLPLQLGLSQQERAAMLEEGRSLFRGYRTAKKHVLGRFFRFLFFFQGMAINESLRMLKNVFRVLGDQVLRKSFNTSLLSTLSDLWLSIPVCTGKERRKKEQGDRAISREYAYRAHAGFLGEDLYSRFCPTHNALTCVRLSIVSISYAGW